MAPLIKFVFITCIVLLAEHALASQDPPKVVIIGAGLSGLTCAYYLQDDGIQVDVYEARNRVGGRVFTAYQGGHLIEFGGQNISDGEEAINILALIEELGLETEKSSMVSNLTYFEIGQVTNVGELLDKRAFNPRALEAKLEKLADTSKNMKEVLQGLFNENDILFKASSVLLTADEGASVNKLSPVYSDALYSILIENSIAANEGDDETDNEIESLMVKGGNGMIVERIAKNLSGHLHLNHVLKGISISPEGSYLLTFDNGIQTQADILILSIPCPVFNSLLVDNKVIPLERLSAIREVQYGQAAKILVPISPPSIDKGSFTNGRAVTFYNRDKYALTLFYIDPYGRFNDQTIREVFQKELPMVERFFTISSHEPPIIARNEAFSSYTGIVGHSWSDDPFALGSYSCIGAGQEELFTSITKVDDDVVKTLFAPLADSLFFCGEHTSILGVGTMEAAVESGVRTSKMVKKKMRGAKPISK